MKIKLSGINYFLMIMAFLAYAVEAKANLSFPETVELTADLQVEECTVTNDLSLCSVPLIPFKNVKVVLDKIVASPSDRYEQWQGLWQDVKTEEGIEFTASLLITKYRHYDENGSFDSYRLEASVGIPDTKAKTLITVSSIDELNSITLIGESVLKPGDDRTVLTPRLHFGRKYSDLILPLKKGI